MTSLLAMACAVAVIALAVFEMGYSLGKDAGLRRATELLRRWNEEAE